MPLVSSEIACTYEVFNMKFLTAMLLLVNLGIAVNGFYVQEPAYAPEPVRQEIVTSTRYWTDTRIHTVWITSTSDVHVTSNSVVFQTVTQYTTQRNFVEVDARTVVSVLRVTNTPVVVKTVQVAQNPVRSVYSVSTKFVTQTQVQNALSTLTHTQVQHQVRTIPVVSTETLRQRILQTETQFITVTITSTKRGYH